MKLDREPQKENGMKKMVGILEIRAVKTYIEQSKAGECVCVQKARISSEIHKEPQ